MRDMTRAAEGIVFCKKTKRSKGIHRLRFRSHLGITCVDEPERICGKYGSIVWNLRDLEHPG